MLSTAYAVLRSVSAAAAASESWFERAEKRQVQEASASCGRRSHPWLGSAAWGRLYPAAGAASSAAAWESTAIRVAICPVFGVQRRSLKKEVPVQKGEKKFRKLKSPHTPRQLPVAPAAQPSLQPALERRASFASVHTSNADRLPIHILCEAIRLSSSLLSFFCDMGASAAEKEGKKSTEESGLDLVRTAT